MVVEDLKVVKERLGLSTQCLASSLGVNVKTQEAIMSGEKKCDEKFVSLFNQMFSFDKDGHVVMCKKINFDKYTSIFNAYSRILKEYYDKPWEIYVLAKVKNKGKGLGILGWFFGNNKASVVNEMATFYPSYLARRDKRYVLISFYSDHFTLSELPDLGDSERFVYRNYRYVRANRLNLK